MIEDTCEGCGVRDTGFNFSHEGLCKKCNDAIMAMTPEELLRGDNGELLSKNSSEKVGAFKRWRDDLEEVEVRLPLPDGATKQTLSVKVEPTKGTLSVTVVPKGLLPMELLAVDPLFDAIKSDFIWYIDAKEIPPCVVITLEKKYVSMWGPTLCKEGGILTCWDGALGPL